LGVAFFLRRAATREADRLVAPLAAMSSSSDLTAHRVHYAPANAHILSNISVQFAVPNINHNAFLESTGKRLGGASLPPVAARVPNDDSNPALVLDVGRGGAAETALAVVVMVHKRTLYLKRIIEVMRRAVSLDLMPADALLIFSHDGHDSAVEALVGEARDFLPNIVQIFHPYSCSEFPTRFPAINDATVDTSIRRDAWATCLKVPRLPALARCFPYSTFPSSHPKSCAASLVVDGQHGVGQNARDQERQEYHVHGRRYASRCRFFCDTPAVASSQRQELPRLVLWRCSAKWTHDLATVLLKNRLASHSCKRARLLYL